MDKPQLCECLRILNENNPCESDTNFMIVLDENIKNVKEKSGIEDCNLDYNYFGSRTLNTHCLRRLYLAYNVYFLEHLQKLLNASNDPLNVLSLEQNKTVRNALQNVILIGIRFNLHPHFDHFDKSCGLSSDVLPLMQALTKKYIINSNSITSYSCVCYTTHHLCKLLSCDVLRPLVILAGFHTILCALYQIAYCPLTKPSGHKSMITQEQYNSFIEDKDCSKNMLNFCMYNANIPRSIMVKETMLLLKYPKQNGSWLMKATAANLTCMMRMSGGVKVMMDTLLEGLIDYDGVDVTKTWQAIDMVTKLIIGLRKASDFKQLFCYELLRICFSQTRRADGVGAYDLVLASCVKTLYSIDVDMCRNVFLIPLLNVLLYWFEAEASCNEYRMQVIRYKNDRTGALQCIARVFKIIFDSGLEEEDINVPKDVPISEIASGCFMLFRVYAATKSSDAFVATKHNLESLLFKSIYHFERESSCNKPCLLRKLFEDSLTSSSLTVNVNETFYTIRAVSVTLLNNEILIECLNNNQSNVSEELNRAQVFIELLNEAPPLFMFASTRAKLAIWLLRFLNNNLNIKNQCIVQSMMLALFNNSDVPRLVAHDYWFMDYLLGKLKVLIANGIHRQSDCDDLGFQSILFSITILQVVPATNKRSIELKKFLQIIRDECVHEELQELTTNVINKISNFSHYSPNTSSSKPITELDAAIKDICDAFLPVRGQGLAKLAKLVEDKHPDVLGRRLYIFNVFYQNVKNEDSFIYLAAIKGLAALGDEFPGMVLETLTEEYEGLDQSVGGSSTSIEDRMKLGEVLIKVSRNLGDRASKYKSILLNTFLSVAKDDDHLMRASSLSNLGEVCQVLGYKLGSIHKEVLDCVRNVIMTDPAVEARRAAVTVIRALFIGLGQETLAFLKDDIQDVFRIVENIHNNDDDEIMRLQAQLALVQLEDNLAALLPASNNLPPHAGGDESNHNKLLNS